MISPELSYPHWLNNTRPFLEKLFTTNQTAACNELRRMQKVIDCGKIMQHKLSNKLANNPALYEARKEICIEIDDLLKQYNCP